MSEEDDFRLSREARARAMGYSEQPFYRGEASGALPDKYHSAFFSRDKEYAAGFAQRGGNEAPREFRLNLSNTFSDRGALTADRFARLIKAAIDHGDHKLANDLAEAVAPGKGVGWIMKFAEMRPGTVVAEAGGAAMLRQAIERSSGGADGIFKSAGYDAIDSGRDVRKLTGEGIRLSDAAFSKARAASRNIRAGIASPIAAGAMAATMGYGTDANAADGTPRSATDRLGSASAAGGVAYGASHIMRRLPAFILRGLGAYGFGAGMYDEFSGAARGEDADRDVMASPQWRETMALMDQQAQEREMARVPERSPRRYDIPR